MGRDKMYVKAYGKVNLGLDVLRRREDGYHEVKMIMQTVSIYDGLDFEKTDSGKIEIGLFRFLREWLAEVQMQQPHFLLLTGCLI